MSAPPDNGPELATETRPARPEATAGLQAVWLHGWGQDRRAFAALADFFTGWGEGLLVDLPGFGETPGPPEPWDTADYADHLAARLAVAPRPGRRVVIGHSFGGRVAIRLAARHPDSVDALILIAGAGLQRQRSLRQRLRAGALKRLGRLAKAVDAVAGTRLHAAYAARFGSADYRNAGALRPTFVKVVTEDLSDEARRVAVPVLLLYGETDTETPPEFAERYAALMPDAEAVILPRLGHLDILGAGAHQVKAQAKRFLAARGLTGEPDAAARAAGGGGR
ncbi:MAG: alpha/beta hydrolase [Azospirillaceae bacterium]